MFHQCNKQKKNGNLKRFLFFIDLYTLPCIVIITYKRPSKLTASPLVRSNSVNINTLRTFTARYHKTLCVISFDMKR